MTTESTPPLAEITIPAVTNSARIEVKAGAPVFILGRNGTGKSALLNHLSANWARKVVYMPGSRPSYFDNENLSLTAASRRRVGEQMQHSDSLPDARWKSSGGTSRNEKAIHDLLAAETQHKIDAANQIKTEGKESPAVLRLQTEPSPLDLVNLVLVQANLPVQLEIANSELQAKQAGSLYSYARMSDGERSALVFAAEVVAAKAGMVFLIDEPELHLHPSIVVSLVKALILARPDCGFVICTHQLEIPIAVQGAKFVLVRGSSWVNHHIAKWDVDVIDDPKEIPEWLWLDVIGARRKMLFIEGNQQTSLDFPLYSLLFPNISIRPRESCKEVKDAVKGLRAIAGENRIEAFGLIDHDGMSEEQVRAFERDGIYPLPIFSVEGLIYSEDVQQALAKQQANTLGLCAQTLLAKARQSALEDLKKQRTKEHLASRLAERQMRDLLFTQIPSRQQLIDSTSDSLEISLPSPYLDQLARLNNLINQADLTAVISSYPIRESGILNAIAKGLEFPSRNNYELAALHLISRDIDLRLVLKQKFSHLAAQLDGITTESSLKV